MSIYDCRKISEFEKAFKIESYDELIEFFRNTPEYFLKENNIKYHKHHILPKHEGGQDLESNLVNLPVYFHIKAHYLRAKEFEVAGNKNLAFKHYQSASLNKIPDIYKKFLKELDIVVESYEKQSNLEKSLRWMSKGEESKRVFEDEIEEYRKQGWTLKKKGTYWWPNGKENVQSANYSVKGFRRGRVKRLIYKSIGDIKVGDQIISPGDNKLHPKIISIQEQGLSDVYQITLNSGKSFRTHKDHLTTVCFRQKNNKPVWDTLRTEWMMNNLDKYHFVILSDYSKLKWPDIVSEMLEHEAEPDDDIIPIEIEGDFVTSIEKIGKENCRCISLNNPEGFYYTNNGIITHNSTWSVLANLFVSTHFAMMWHPYKYFNLAVSTMFTQVLGAWNMKKASELLLEPFMQILEASPYFKRVRTHTDLLEANGADLVNSLHYTTSTPTAQPLDSKIIMADGSTKIMGEIEIGDKLKSPSEGTTEVINIPYHGVADCYEIELEDGRTVRCSSQHLWNVRRTPEADWEVVDLQYILDHPEFDWEIRELSDF